METVEDVEKAINPKTAMLWFLNIQSGKGKIMHLSVGAIANVAILSMRQGTYDKTGYKMKAKQKFECEMTIKGGKVVYDLHGIVSPLV